MDNRLSNANPLTESRQLVDMTFLAGYSAYSGIYLTRAIARYPLIRHKIQESSTVISAYKGGVSGR